MWQRLKTIIVIILKKKNKKKKEWIENYIRQCE